MMKKLLVLALVLVVSTVASAGFVLAPAVDQLPGNIVITISNDGGITSNGYLVIAVQGIGVLSSALGADAPVNSSLNGNTVDSEVAFLGQGDVYGVADFALAPAVPVYKTGTWLTATLTGGVAGDVVKAYSSADLVEFTEIGSFVVTPEPVTVALLGLGGLFIRRNKK